MNDPAAPAAPDDTVTTGADAAAGPPDGAAAWPGIPFALPPEPSTATLVPGPGGRRRRHRRRQAGVVTAAALAGAAAATVLAGAGLAGPGLRPADPAQVQTVTGSGEALGYAADVYATAHRSVVLVRADGGGVGSGFFYAPTRIVTNAHVVAPAAASQGAGSFEVDVLLPDGRERRGTVLAADARIDLAIVEVEPGLGLPVLPFADGPVVPGQPVATLGYPFGGGLMVTTGVLSGVSTNSRFAESDAQQLLLQTDAPVNPGNSGGPLLDASGAVLGVVTLRPDEADGRQVTGMTLAIPADVTVAALTQLETDGRVAYPALGVMLNDATTDDPVARGAIVVQVNPGTAAAKAGVTEGEVIVAVDGTPVAAAADVIRALVGRRPGDTVTVTVDTGHGPATDRRVTLGTR